MPYYDGDNGERILHFGYGDIRIGYGHQPNGPENEVCFVAGLPGEVGRRGGEMEGKTTAELPTPVRMIFDNTDALDVVIERLVTLRAKMDAPAGEKT